MEIGISLKNTTAFFEFAKECSKLFDDYEFELQIHYFDELCARDKVTSEDLMALLDVIAFWEFWLNDLNALKQYTSMVIEVVCYACALMGYNVTAKIKEEN